MGGTKEDGLPLDLPVGKFIESRIRDIRELAYKVKNSEPGGKLASQQVEKSITVYVRLI